MDDTTSKVFDLVDLAFEIADEVARADVEGHCCSQSDLWWDTNAAAVKDRQFIARALRYIDLRGDALPYHVDRKDTLIKFRDKHE